MISGTSDQKCPNAAYRSTFAHIDGGGICHAICKSPAKRPVLIRQSSDGGVIAMQKVVGSNPISRFEGKPRPGMGISLQSRELTRPFDDLGPMTVAQPFRTARKSTPGQPHIIWRRIGTHSIFRRA
jgi:hypothetical protein